MRLRLVMFCFLFTGCGQVYDSASETNLSSQEFGEEFHHDKSFPKGPHLEMTPGETCKNPDQFRYPEKIAYCTRDVESSRKHQIIRTYDESFGYQIRTMSRSDFKIDHYIPLCMGGSNATVNLWPQHKSIYNLTDHLEQRLCELLAKAALKQTEAIEEIQYAKNHLEEVSSITQRLEQTYGRN